MFQNSNAFNWNQRRKSQRLQASVFETSFVQGEFQTTELATSVLLLWTGNINNWVLLHYGGPLLG